MAARISLFLGKGGVGRTTLAAAFATDRAVAGERVLLVSVVDNDNPASRISHEAAGVETGGRLVLQRIDARKLVDELVRRITRLGPMADFILHHPSYDSLVDIVPGVREMAIFHRLGNLRDEGYDRIIVDAPATGHGIHFLEAPEKSARILAGPLRHRAEELRAMLQDPAITDIVLVTLAEEMPVRETLELAGVLAWQGFHVDNVAVNKWLPPFFENEGSRRVLASLTDDLEAREHFARDIAGRAPIDVREWLSALNLMAAQRAEAKSHLADLRALDAKLSIVPWIPDSSKRLLKVAEAMKRPWGGGVGEPRAGVAPESPVDSSERTARGGAIASPLRTQDRADAAFGARAPHTQLVVMLGTGGVGKTTISAATALEASRRRKTLVLTVDPARRLADALGVKLGSEIVNVGPNLDALMLDTKAALDALVKRYAPSADTLGRILSSRFYEQLSDAFAGSEEFVAMGTLHDLVADGRYDVIVVDTPPSTHAIEFLRVNRKLIRVYESGVVKYLFKPTRFLRMGGGYMMNVLSRWTSSEYIEEMAEFMTTFDQMFSDMETRVRAIDEVLTDPTRTSLRIVATAEEESVPQTARLYHDVTSGLGLPIESCIVNRYYPRLKGLEVQMALADPAYHAGAVRRLVHATHAGAGDASEFLDDALRAGRFYEALAADHEKYGQKLREEVPLPFRFVPAMPGSIHDLKGLERVRAALFE